MKIPIRRRRPEWTVGETVSSVPESGVVEVMPQSLPRRRFVFGDSRSRPQRVSGVKSISTRS